MRNKRGLNKIGMLAIALIIALGAVGVTYGAWVDEIYIDGSLSTGDVNTSLSCGTCWEEVNGIVTDVEDTDIDCEKATSTMLTISVTNAQFNTDPTLKPHYYCNFIVSNAANSFPVTVTTLNISNPYSGSGVTAVITDDLEVGDVINPGGTATGKVHIYLTNDTKAGYNLTFALTVQVN